MKLAIFRRIVLFISVIALALSAPAAELVSVSAAAADSPAPVPAQEIRPSSRPQASIEDEPAVPAGSAASQSSVRHPKKAKASPQPVAAQIPGDPQDPGAPPQDHRSYLR